MSRNRRKQKRQAKLLASMSKSMKQEMERIDDLSQAELLSNKQGEERDGTATNSLADFFSKEQLEKLDS